MLNPVSTGLRFTTLPPSLTPSSQPISPPTTLTLLYNPLIGFISSAYSAQVSPTVALSSRFGVNVYSYESDLSIGGEWWIGRRRGKKDISPPVPVHTPLSNGISLRGEDVIAERRLDSPFPLAENTDPVAEKTLDSPIPLKKDKPSTRLDPRLSSMRQAMKRVETGETDRDGVLKARLSGNWVCPLLISSPGRCNSQLRHSRLLCYMKLEYVIVWCPLVSSRIWRPRNRFDR